MQASSRRSLGSPIPLFPQLQSNPSRSSLHQWIPVSQLSLMASTRRHQWSCEQGLCHYLWRSFSHWEDPTSPGASWARTSPSTPLWSLAPSHQKTNGCTYRSYIKINLSLFVTYHWNAVLGSIWSVHTMRLNSSKLHGCLNINLTSVTSNPNVFENRRLNSKGNSCIFMCAAEILSFVTLMRGKSGS